MGLSGKILTNETRKIDALKVELHNSFSAHGNPIQGHYLNFVIARKEVLDKFS